MEAPTPSPEPESPDPGPSSRDDPTVAGWHRAGTSLDIEHDLMQGADCAITRWEFFSAPFSIELCEGLRARLANSWKDREPGHLVGEREPNPASANYGWL